MTENEYKPTAEDNKAKSVEAAHALLTRITNMAHAANLTSDIHALAESYATVVGAMPRASRGERTGKVH